MTRTQPGADALVLRLRDLGYDAVAAPLLKAEATGTPYPCSLEAIDGVILTSAQALHYLPPDFPRDRPLYAVGYASADAARKAGFTNVHDGGGTVALLGRHVRSENSSGTWLHIGTTEPAEGTHQSLAGIGTTLLHWPVYRTIQNSFDTGILREDDLITVHSAKAAGFLRQAVQSYGRPETISKMSLLCLSEAVLECLRISGFGHTYISDTPDENALINTLAVLCPVPPR